jgi:hypothetical protein
MSTEFSLERFESQIQSHDYDAAHEEFNTLLKTLSESRGTLGTECFARTIPDAPEHEESQRTLQRIADGFTTLYCAPEYTLPAEKMGIMYWGRPWINMILQYRRMDRPTTSSARFSKHPKATITRRRAMH